MKNTSQTPHKSMKKFSHKQIAAQSGLSLATIDRALHQRGRVHPQTQQRIRQAMADLELQYKAGLAQGRTLWFDVILHTPQRFSELVREAFISQIASFASFRIQLRFHCFEQIGVAQLDALLKKCGSDSHGIILKAMHDPALEPTLAVLLKQRVPVVTIVTDLPESARLRYIGMDNASAGEAAAFLMSRWLKRGNARIMAVTGSDDFTGEQERIAGFRRAMSRFDAGCTVKVVAGGFGIDAEMYHSVSAALAEELPPDGLYTVGGGNGGILQALAERGIRPDAIIAHDLDRENRALLQAGQIDVLIEHNLQLDAQHAFRTLLGFHHFLPESTPWAPWSRINVITRYNMPS